MSKLIIIMNKLSSIPISHMGLMYLDREPIECSVIVLERTHPLFEI